MDDLYQTLLKAYKNKDKHGYTKVKDDVVKALKSVKKSSFKYDNFNPYPEYDEEDFNIQIYKKKEFNRNKIDDDLLEFDEESNKRCSTTSFTLTPNQKFIKSFLSPLTPYNGLLMYHGVGLGKTCTAISIAEQYHEMYNKKILVILSSTLIDNFKKQIFDITKYDLKTNTANLCTGTKYPEMVLNRETMDDATLEKKINKLISEKYQFLGYKELANIIERDHKISETFSDRLIIVDEAHNLRNPSEKVKTKKGNMNTAMAFKKMILDSKNVKLVLLTATPMFNAATEIIWIINLLLANDKRPEITKRNIFDESGYVNEEELSRIIRGYVTFMRGENPFAFPFRLFPSINKDTRVIQPEEFPTHDLKGKSITLKPINLELIGSQMSSNQKKLYNLLKSKVPANVADEVDEDTSDVNNDIQNTLQVSNIVYPLFIGNQTNIELSKGFLESFTLSKKKYKYKDSIQKSEHKNFLAYSNIEQYAPKIKNVLDYVIKSDGIVLIYSRYYSSGILPLALALEHIGFLKYKKSGERHSLSANIDVDNKFSTGKSPRYVIISGDTELSPNNASEIVVAKSKQNMNGEIIKVIIVSKVGTEGIDFKRIREVHLLDPWFNLNRAEQVIGRGVRYCSHIDLPKEKRNVTIYLHACKYDKKEESVDLQVYRMAWRKQKQISQVERVLKETAIDCNLNQKALFYPVDKMNISFDIITSQGKLVKDFRVGDRDNSYVCGFGPCSLNCKPEVSGNVVVDKSTYDKKFLEDDIDLYKRYIALLYKQNIYLTYEKILEFLRKDYKVIDEDILAYALDEMLQFKYLVQDKNGRNGYLIYRSNKYIFQSSQIADTRISMDEREIDVPRHARLPLSELVTKSPQQNQVRQAPNVTVDVLKKVDTLFAQKKLLIQNILIDGFIHPLSQGDAEAIFERCKNKPSKYEHMLIYKNYYKPKQSSPPREMDIKTALESIGNVLKLFPDSIIIDSILDKLTHDEFKLLIETIINMHNTNQMTSFTKQCLQSYVGSQVVFVTGSNEIKYYFDYFTDKLQCMKSNNTFNDCDPLDMRNIPERYHPSKLTRRLNDDTKGYIAIIDKKDPIFKVKDSPKNNGYVCQTFSKVDYWRVRINETFKNNIAENIEKLIPTNSNVINHKADFCYFFEILLRCIHKNNFQRPLNPLAVAKEKGSSKSRVVKKK